jgi:hypothetical protein
VAHDDEMKRMSAVTLAVLFVFSVPAARAEDVDGPHRRVRVTLRSADMVQGFLRGKSADEVVVYTADRHFRRVALHDIQRFEVRQRTGSHWKRGALIGAVVWISAMKIAAVDSLEEAGLASWQSGAIFAGSVGAGAAIGAGVPRYGWQPADPRSAAVVSAPQVRVTLRF